MFDLTACEGVQQYLEQTPFAAIRVEELTGGYANYAYRITLREPYPEPGFSNAPIRTLVMKHAKPYVAAWKDVPFAIERQEFEGEAFNLVPQLVASSSIVSLPRLYYEDRTHRVILMTDCGPESLTLKAALQSGQLSDGAARDIGAALGTFLAQLHAATSTSIPGTPGHRTKTIFARNGQARGVAGFFFFGHIMRSINDDPLLLVPPDIRDKLESFAEKAQERVNTSNEVLNMGDFQGGNLLVMLEPAPHVMVIDWEIARPGFMGMDLGPFLGELHLLRVFHPTTRACVDIVVSAFLSAYRAVMLTSGDRADAEQRLVETAYDTAARLGTQLVTVTPRVRWGGPEQTREVVWEGIEYILRSVDRDEAWMRESLVGKLWG